MNVIAEKIIPTENGDAWPFLMQMEMADAHLRELLNAMADEVEDDRQAALIAGALALMDSRKEAHTQLFEFCRATSQGKISNELVANSEAITDQKAVWDIRHRVSMSRLMLRLATERTADLSTQNALSVAEELIPLIEAIDGHLEKVEEYAQD